jgi:hypothetical protein
VSTTPTGGRVVLWDFHGTRAKREGTAASRGPSDLDAPAERIEAGV